MYSKHWIGRLSGLHTSQLQKGGPAAVPADGTALDCDLQEGWVRHCCVVLLQLGSLCPLASALNHLLASLSFTAARHQEG